MKLKVHHYTLYQYESPVFLEPQHLYFFPLQRPHLKLVKWGIRIFPEPAGLSQRIDLEGNVYHQCWNNNTTDHFEIIVDFEAEVSSFNPFDFLMEEIKGRKFENPVFRVYLQKDPLDLSKDLIRWVDERKKEEPLDSIRNLTNEVHKGWSHQISYSSKLQHPNECFISNGGSCRDLSWMLIQMLRYLEIPSRFVSGYSHNAEIDGHELHAWVESWVDGAGWIAHDPSSGMFTTEHYVPVAVSHHPKLTLPVQGSYRGSASSKLETRVDIELLIQRNNI